MFRLFSVVTALFFFASPAHAEWRRASSDHFVVYSESRAADLRDFAETLERFHKAMELETGVTIPSPSPSSRLTVYMVGNDRELKELYGNRNSNVAGFYVPRASGSIAFVPFIKIGSGGPDFSFTVLLHEYAHHFLISSSRHAMPRWLSEGSAEYFASARFHSDGSVDIGLPNNDRAWELANASKVSLDQLFDREKYRQKRGRSYDAFYGRSWLLYHYLRFEESREGQLNRYRASLNGGMDPLAAAQAAFGDLGQLEGELRAYNKRRRMAGMRFGKEVVTIGKIDVSDLSEGHSAMMDVIMQSARGVTTEQAADLLVKARAIANNYPADPAVQAGLAEAEYDAEDDTAAIAAAERALKFDATNKKALIFKGLALFRQAQGAEERDVAYRAAMKPFQQLNAIENDHPLPLIYFYRSFTERGRAPSDQAEHALERALQLAPFDHDLALQVATMHASKGNAELASYILAPIAANPHGGERAAFAVALSDALSNVPEGTPINVAAVRDTMVDEAEIDDEDDDSADEGEEETRIGPSR